MAVVERIRAIVEPLVATAGMDLYDVEHNGGTVRVLVHRPDGLDMDAITRLTRSISRALDEDDPVPGRYTLEVSSPGLERPLRRPEHFHGALGVSIKVKTRPGFDGPRRLTGVLVAADGECIRVDTGSDEPITVDMADLSSARTVFEWGPGPKPGRSRTRSEHSTSADSTADSSDREARSS